MGWKNQLDNTTHLDTEADMPHFESERGFTVLYRKKTGEVVALLSEGEHDANPNYGFVYTTLKPSQWRKNWKHFRVKGEALYLENKEMTMR